MLLTQILDKHVEKYNNLKIENNFDLLKREFKLKEIESYYSLKHLPDKELREVIFEKAVQIRKKKDQLEIENRNSEEHYDYACRIEYWFELTDELKEVYILPSK
jgi:hypothetical protein